MDKKTDMYKSVDEQAKYYVNCLIHSLMNHFGMTLSSIAEILGVSRSAVSLWYSGKNIPSLNHYLSLMNLWRCLCGRGGVHYD